MRELWFFSHFFVGWSVQVPSADFHSVEFVGVSTLRFWQDNPLDIFFDTKMATQETARDFTRTGGDNADVSVAQKRVDEKEQGGEEENAKMWKYDCILYPYMDILDAHPLFNSQNEAYQSWDELLATAWTKFNSVGYTLAVPLSTFEDPENPYFYMMFFDGFD